MPELRVRNEALGWDLRVPFQGRKVTVGSGSGNSICLPGEGVAASHFLILASPQGYRLRAMSATVATRVDGDDVFDEVDLAHGARIEAGPYRIEFLDEAPAPSASDPTRRREPQGDTRVARLDPDTRARRAPAAAPTRSQEVPDLSGPANPRDQQEDSFETLDAEPDLSADLPPDLPPVASDSDAPSTASGVIAAAARTVRPTGASGSKSKTGSDRRGAPRTDLQPLRCELKLAGMFSALKGNQAPIQVRVLDLSEQGARVVTTAPLDKKSGYSIKFSNGRLGDIQVPARIVWLETIQHKTHYGEEVNGVVAGLALDTKGVKQRDIVKDTMTRKRKPAPAPAQAV